MKSYRHELWFELPQRRGYFCVPLDLARSETFPPLVAEVLARTAQIDVLVNNGGLLSRIVRRM